MQKRTLARTELSVSEIALGTWSLTMPGATADNARATIDRATALGVNLFETAEHYEIEGESIASLLGACLNKDSIVCLRGGLDTTAAPSRKRFERVFLHRSAARAAERLKRPVDIYLLHHPTSDTVKMGEATGALHELKSEGIIANFGVATTEIEIASTAIEEGASVIEIPFNVFTAQHFRPLVDHARTQNVGVLARSPLAYGLLCGTWPADKTFASDDHRAHRWTREELTSRLRQVANLRPLVNDDVHTVRTVALRFVLAHMLASAVVGVRNPSQLEANIREVGETWTIEQADKVLELIKA
jgi:aryl-alcohol dehydrogenase-like predicted oxidoreductase